jgi:hypothetical protein
MFYFIKWSWWSSFYVPPVFNPEDPEEGYKCYENTAVVFVSIF